MERVAARSAVQRVKLELRMRRLTVERVEDLSATLRRVALGGPELAGFVANGPTDHAKVFFPATPGGEPLLPDPGTWAGRQDERYVCRDYTVRTFVPSSDELVLDMAVHSHGPAGRWVAQAQPGQQLGIYGPKSTKLPPVDRSWYLLVADETGLPALTNWFDRLPAGRPVHAFIEVGGPADEVALPARDGAAVTWLHRGDAAPGTTTLLADAVAGAALPGRGEPWVWAGAESSAARAVRKHMIDERQVARRSVATTGYWQVGVANFDHKATAE